MRLTDSPYDKLMREPPHYDPMPFSSAPKGSHCHGCPYWRGIVCVSCYQDLLKKPGIGR